MRVFRWKCNIARCKPNLSITGLSFSFRVSLLELLDRISLIASRLDNKIVTFLTFSPCYHPSLFPLLFFPAFATQSGNYHVSYVRLIHFTYVYSTYIARMLLLPIRKSSPSWIIFLFLSLIVKKAVRSRVFLLIYLLFYFLIFNFVTCLCWSSFGNRTPCSGMCTFTLCAPRFLICMNVKRQCR